MNNHTIRITVTTVEGKPSLVVPADFSMNQIKKAVRSRFGSQCVGLDHSFVSSGEQPRAARSDSQGNNLPIAHCHWKKLTLAFREQRCRN